MSPLQLAAQIEKDAALMQAQTPPHAVNAFVDVGGMNSRLIVAALRYMHWQERRSGWPYFTRGPCPFEWREENDAALAEYRSAAKAAGKEGA